MYSLLLTEGVFVRVPVKDCFHFPLRPDQFEKTLDVEEFSVPVAQSVMDEEHGRPPVGTFQEAGEPFSLRLAQQSGGFIRVKQRVENHEAQGGTLDDEHVFAGNLLPRARGMAEYLEEIAAVIMVAQTNINGRLLPQRREQLLE